MKLELKHVVGYLPYGLKCYNHYHPKLEINVIGFEKDSLLIVYDDSKFYSAFGAFKPILRPLSDLTKEIEVNGEKFVPIEELKRVNRKIRFSDNRFMDYDDGKSKDVLHFSFYDIFSYSLNFEEITEITNKLYEWHFDIHGLIENGLAIDINTLK